MDEWVDSEFEDSPVSNHAGIGGVFSQSPNGARKASTASGGRGGTVPRTFSTDSLDSLQYYPQAQHYPAQPRAPHFQDVPVRMVPESAAGGSAASKRAVIRGIQEQSLKMLSMACQAVVVRGASGSYHVYHLEITSDYYRQKWIVCKRYSEFYRLRKKLLARLAAHKKARGCGACGALAHQLRDFDFPKRLEMFQDKLALVAKRTAGLEAFIGALCQYLAGDGDMAVCPEITSIRFAAKEFLLFPLEHECQHVRAIRQLKYVDPRDVHVDSEACPICLSDWGELDGNQLVLAPCGHFFHEHCINEWYRTRFDCPMCRTIAGQE
ncbi:hypothetical protein PybrP1_000641 [[Pythium] brassicae (nom. inval.)]|nr:hypothetical protein PybrP1_000641 [[Pythium] brassicae (nom. inval.)]